MAPILVLPGTDGHCGICGLVRPLVRDHNHETGFLRGFICKQCNWMLGLARDSPETLEAAIAYLARPATGILHSPPRGSDEALRMEVAIETKRLRFEAAVLEVLPLAVSRVAARKANGPTP